MRDLRDPGELGLKLLEAREGVDPCFGLSKIADHTPLHTRDYDHNPGTIEKYGWPQDLPSTMP